MPLLKLSGRQIAQSINENTWDAINAAQGNADMCFGSCEIIDETTGERWVFREGEPYEPIDIPYGHEVGVSFLCENCGEIPVKVFVYIELIDPDGIARASARNPRGSIPNELNPGVGYYSEYIGGVALDKAGLWLVYGRLEYDIA
jgi:hypothetical protein